MSVKTLYRLVVLGVFAMSFHSVTASAELCAEPDQAATAAAQAKPGSGLSCVVGGIDHMGVSNAYTYPTSPQQKNGAAFMTITNTGDQDIRIVRAESSIAETVELHTHKMDGDTMMMREVDGFDVPAGGEIHLEPTGHHIMLMGLTKQLIKDEGFVLRLHAEDGQSYVMNVFPSFGDDTL